MFRGKYQSKLLTILYSGGSNPLEIWDIQVKNGWTRRVKDEDMGTIVFEICGTNVATAYIVSPPDPKRVLGITLPFITMFIKNLKRYFTFEIQILDDKQMRRRFRFSNYQSTTKVRPFTCSVPLALKPGWNQMQLNLANFTMRAYGTNYMETQRVQVHANCRVRRIYFSDRLYSEEELPRDYRIYLNVRQAPPPPAAQQQQQQQELPPAVLQRLSQALAQETAPRASTHHSILKRMSKPEEEVEEAIVSETSFKSKPSLQEVQSVTKSSIKSTTSVAADTQTEPRTATVVSAEPRPALDQVESRTSKASLKAEEGESGVAIGEGESEVGAVQEDAVVVGEIPLEVAQAEETDAEEATVTAELTDLETPRTDVTESEYAESEPVLESDVEEAASASAAVTVEDRPEEASPEPPEEHAEAIEQ